jgi:hypothetical protein
MKTALNPCAQRRHFGRCAFFASFLLSVVLTKVFGACVTASSGAGWQNTIVTPAPTGTFTVTFDATPSASPTNSVIALSNGAQTAYANFACLVRFNPSGDIDARNGGSYVGPSTPIPYSAGVSCHFRLVVNLSAQTYSIYVTPAGGSELTVGLDFAFRISDPALNYWGVYVDSASGGKGTDAVCNFTVVGQQQQTATPIFSPPAGTYSSSQNVSISDSTGGAAIYYTTDGTAPTTSSTIYSGSISVGGGTVTIEAIAVANGVSSSVASGAYTIGGGNCVMPTAGGGWKNNPIASQAGTFTVTYDVTPSTSPTNAVVALSNGAQTSYSNFACLVRFNPSGDIDARNGGSYVGPSAPISYSAGTSYHFRLVVNTAAQTYSIYVTPAGGSELNVGTNFAFRISENSFNNWGAYVDSSTGRGSLTVCNFTIDENPIVAPPSFSPAPGVYAPPLSVSISDSTAGAAIYYTTDGSTPTTSSAVYSGAISMPVGTTTLSAVAAGGAGSSAVTSGSYTVNQQMPPPPTFSPPAGTYTTVLSVSITDSITGATIYYTANGSMPSTTSTVYFGPIPIPVGTTTLSAIAANSGGSSTPAVGSYTVATPPPPTFSPPSGSYAAPLSVSIGDSTGSATIYYTTNGSVPTTASTVYSSPISLPAGNWMFSAIAVDGAGASMAANASYVVTSGGTVATPLFSPAAGPFYAATPVTITSATPGATIRYTTDGSTPTDSNGTIYTGPVTMPVAVDTNMTASTATNGSGITMLKAVAYESGMQDSAVFTGNYIIIVPLRFAKTTSMVLGMAHMAYNVTSANWTEVLNIWTHDIGYATVEVTGSSPNRFALIKINDQQFIELYEVTSLPSTGVGGHPAQYQLRNWGFYVTDAQAFQSQVQSAGVSITSSCSVNALGNLSFFTTDPDGHADEWIQYLPGSVTSQTLGQDMPGTQLFGYIEDFGDATANVTAANTYYDKFGFNGRGTKVYLPNNNCYLEMLTYTALTQAEAGVHEKTQLVNFRGFTIQQSGAAVVARDPNIPRVVTGSEGGSGFPSHGYYDLYNADLSRIRLIDINY